MGELRRRGWALALLSVLAWVATPRALRGETPVGSGPEIYDAALAAGGVLRGQVVRRSASSELEVVVRQDGREIARTSARRSGEFELRGLRGGVYHVVAGDEVVVVRAWAPGTAPPAAATELLLVAAPAVRGQYGPVGMVLTHPLVSLSLLTAAIVIPVALHANRNDRASSS